jgi:hypothetical protein
VVKEKNRRLMHGVGLLRLSRTPVTVDTDAYVVFVEGWLAPRTFESWSSANAYFVECAKVTTGRKPKRLWASTHKRAGRPEGAGIYERMLAKTGAQ